VKIYTRKGDKGSTGLFGGTKVSKGHIRIDSYGSVDELNAYVGYVQAFISDPILKEEILSIQNHLFVIGSLLASDGTHHETTLPNLEASSVLKLESLIDQIEQELPELKSFILPGGNEHVAICHITRSVCRRAERNVVRLSETAKVDAVIIRYLNRLSDFLFVLSRKIAKDEGSTEVIWKA